jgi:antitoxin HigA-1
VNNNSNKLTHPGEVLLKKFLGPMNLTQKDFAAHLNWTYARLNEIINIKRSVTADSALAFSEALGTTPEYWLDLQRDWDLHLAKKHHIPVKKFPQ